MNQPTISAEHPNGLHAIILHTIDAADRNNELSREDSAQRGIDEVLKTNKNNSSTTTNPFINLKPNLKRDINLTEPTTNINKENKMTNTTKAIRAFNKTNNTKHIDRTLEIREERISLDTEGKRCNKESRHACGWATMIRVRIPGEYATEYIVRDSIAIRPEYNNMSTSDMSEMIGSNLI